MKRRTEKPSDSPATAENEIDWTIASDDFANEHQSMTVADSERGGPEGITETESPRGYGGADMKDHHLIV
jgi:hypothetical protein